MKGTFFNKPIEWNVETVKESWAQGDILKGNLSIKNHGTDTVSLENSGIGLAYAEIKKVQTRVVGSLTPEVSISFEPKELKAGEQLSLEFAFPIPKDGRISDKKSSFYLTYGKDFVEAQLQISVSPDQLFTKIIGLLDTFFRFKIKEIKSSKKGVEYKLLPPSSREMANITSLILTFLKSEDKLLMSFDFQVKRLDTASVTTKINTESIIIKKELSPKEYSLGGDMINQDQLLKTFESVLGEVKLKGVF